MFVAGKDEDALEQALSGKFLARDKWDRRENGVGSLVRTIGNAIGVLNGQYEPRLTHAEARKAAAEAPKGNRAGETPGNASGTSA